MFLSLAVALPLLHTRARSLRPIRAAGPDCGDYLIRFPFQVCTRTSAKIGFEKRERRIYSTKRYTDRNLQFQQLQPDACLYPTPAHGFWA